MEEIPPSPQRRFYYGWVIVGLAMISMGFWFAIRATFSVFFAELVDRFHWGRAEAAGVQSLTLFVYMATAPIIGTLVDRVGPRKVVVAGAFLTGVGLLLCTQIQSLLQFYLFFGLIVGVGSSGLSIAPFTVVLTHWFERKRGTANGLAGVGMGVGIFLFLPLIQYLISLYGWRVAFLVFGLLSFLIPLPLNAIFLRRTPKEMGCLPDGDLYVDPSGSDHKIRTDRDLRVPIPKQDPSLSDVIRTVRFWLLLIFPSLTSLGVYVILVHHTKHLIDLGVEKLWAASLFAGMGALSAAFRFFWGWFSDRRGREITFTLGGICFSSGILFLILFQYYPLPPVLYLFVIFFGMGWGATAPMYMSIAADLYKGKNFGLIYGVLEAAIGVGAAIGSWIAGYIFDKTGTYLWAFILAILLNIISIILAWFVAPRKARPIQSRA